MDQKRYVWQTERKAHWSAPILRPRSNDELFPGPVTPGCRRVVIRWHMTSDNTTAKPSTIEAERFALFVSRVTDYAIYMLSPEGIVKSWNLGAERFKGYKPDEIIGKHFSTFYTAEDVAAGVPDRAIATAITQGKFEDEGLRVRKDGTRFLASVVLDPIHDEAGKLLGFTKIT